MGVKNRVARWMETQDEDSTSHSDNDAPFGDPTYRIKVDDWSSTGGGSHVDFEKQETVPLEQGRFLGRGSMGDVHEVNVQGLNLAHKRILCRQKIGDRERREIEILKKLSHSHIVQVVGTYTHNKFLGIIMYPVAVCDLATFFEDVEAWTNLVADHPQSATIEMLDSSSKERLDALGYTYPVDSSKRLMATPMYAQIGCLLSAVAYLHNQQIRHKDIKPSNILLTRNNIWLSDFGSATDFSLLSQSATDNERGTPRYFAPEMARREACGRAADIFSLGCVLLEIIVIHRCGTLNHVRQNRSPDPYFYANLDRIDGWLQHSVQGASSARDSFLNCEVKRMLAAEPSDRPTMPELLVSFSAAQMAVAQVDGGVSIFGGCCKGMFTSLEQHQSQVTKLRRDVKEMEARTTELADRFRDLLDEKEKDENLRASLQNRYSKLELDNQLLSIKYQMLERGRDLLLDETKKGRTLTPWTNSPYIETANRIAGLKRSLKEMDLQEMVDTILAVSRATKDTKYKGSTEETNAQGADHSQLETAERAQGHEEESAALAEIDREIYTGMEAIEDVFEELHIEVEKKRKLAKERRKALLSQATDKPKSKEPVKHRRRTHRDKIKSTSSNTLNGSEDIEIREIRASRLPNPSFRTSRAKELRAEVEDS